MPSRSPFTGRERATLVGVVVLFANIGFAETAVIAVLPTAAKDLGGIGSFGWLFTGFLVAKIVGLVVAGQYSDRHGPRVVLAVGLALFFAGVIVGGAAPTMGVLVAGRALTGFGDGMLLTSVYVVIGQVYPDEATPKVQAAIGSSFVVPTLAGPLIAGIVAQQLNWRLAFLGLGPFMLIAIALLLPVLRAVDRPPEQTVRRNTLPFAIAVAAAITAMESIGQHPPRWPVLAAVAVPAVALLAWGLHGVVPAGTFRMRRGVPAPIALRGIYGGAFFGGSALIPLVMTLQHGYSASVAALPVAASDVGWALGSWIQGRPPSRGDEREYRVRLVRVGFGLTVLGLIAGAAVAYSSVPGWWMFPGWCAAGLGAGMTFTTFNVLVLRHTTDADRGFDSAASQLSGSAGQAITTGVAGVLIAAAAQQAIGFDTAFATVYLGMAVPLVLGCAAAAQLRAPVPVEAIA
jgi:MFS family permease